VDQDDAEKRIVDLERQLGEQRGADRPPARPPQPANAAPEPGRTGSRKRARIWSLATGLWTGMLLLWIGVAGLGYAAYFSYGYWVGTPTTATVDHCEWGGLIRSSPDSSMYCDGTWSVGGQSQKGPIRPPFTDNDVNRVGPGSSLDVHVSDGTAYTADSLGFRFYLGIILGPIFLVWGSASLRRAWRGRNRG
jgi:hypothetical protein